MALGLLANQLAPKVVLVVLVHPYFEHTPCTAIHPLAPRFVRVSTPSFRAICRTRIPALFGFTCPTAAPHCPRFPVEFWGNWQDELLNHLDVYANNTYKAVRVYDESSGRQWKLIYSCTGKAQPPPLITR